MYIVPQKTKIATRLIKLNIFNSRTSILWFNWSKNSSVYKISFPRYPVLGKA